MSLKRSEAEVVGHDTAVHAAIDELTEGRRGADPLYDDEPGQQRKQRPNDRANLYRFQDVTVPPGVAKKMAEIDLRDVDEGKQANEEDEEDEAPVVVPRHAISPWFLVAGLAMAVIVLLVWIAIPKGTSTTPSPVVTQSAALAAIPPAPSANLPEERVISAPIASESVAPDATNDVSARATPSTTRSTSAAKGPDRPAATPTSDVTQPPAASASPKKPDFVIPDVEF
jgi:hypothetical protein